MEWGSVDPPIEPKGGGLRSHIIIIYDIWAISSNINSKNINYSNFPVGKMLVFFKEKSPVKKGSQKHT